MQRLEDLRGPILLILACLVGILLFFYFAMCPTKPEPCAAGHAEPRTVPRYDPVTHTVQPRVEWEFICDVPASQDGGPGVQ